MATPFRVLLYYRYTRIGDPEAFAAAQRELCGRLGLRGRIIVAAEGINGTLAGETAAAEEYVATMRGEPATADMEFKVDASEGQVFKKLSVKVRPEIVALHLDPADDIDPSQITGRHLSPAEFRAAMAQEGAIVLDGRNRYESELGRFKGAVCPDVEHFRDLPGWIRDNLAHAKDRPILTYCTGGIRCEKLSGFLLKEGFQTVAQLAGGIVGYGKDPEVGGRDFEGRCYVFDGRIAVPVNAVNPNVVAHCRACAEPCERCVNCAWQPCNAKIILCGTCEDAGGRFCSAGCRDAADSA